MDPLQGPLNLDTPERCAEIMQGTMSAQVGSGGTKALELYRSTLINLYIGTPRESNLYIYLRHLSKMLAIL